MKVPEKNPLETDKNNDINDISLYRKKKKKAKRILTGLMKSFFMNPKRLTDMQIF